MVLSCARISFDQRRSSPSCARNNTSRPIETRRVRPDAVDVSERDHEWRGGPVDLYLRLWSRCASDPVDDLERWWRETISVTW